MQQDETAWLIELPGPVYCGETKEFGPTMLGLVKDSLAAVRFSRKEDAEALIKHFEWDDAKAVEHMWPIVPIRR